MANRIDPIAPNKPTPIRVELRDATIIPAEISKRLRVIVARIGMSAWQPEAQMLVQAWIDGRAPATWRAWQNFQRIEQAAQQIVTGGKRTRPMILIDGVWAPAPLTAREHKANAANVAPVRKPRRAKAKTAIGGPNVIDFRKARSRIASGGDRDGPQAA
jgi:hypothetical protein